MKTGNITGIANVQRKGTVGQERFSTTQLTAVRQYRPDQQRLEWYRENLTELETE